MGRYAESESTLKRILSNLALVSMENESEAAEAHSSLGLLYFRQGRYREAEQSYRRALATHKPGPNQARDLANLAKVFAATERYAKADAACLEAIDLLTRSLGADHVEVGATLEILANVRQKQDRHAEAADLLTKSLAIAMRSYGPDHLEVSLIINSIGVLQATAKNYGEAEAQFRKALLIQEKLGSNARKEHSMTLQNLALTYRRQGRYDEALDTSLRALALREADLSEIDSSVLEIMTLNVELLRKCRRKTEAAKLERVVRQAQAGQKGEESQRWLVDFRELQKKK
jgi:tetratricopeptide (TPR) repeat protein